MDWLTVEVIWLILGMVLVLLEFVLPGLVVIFFGFGAFVTGLLIWAGMPGNGAVPFLVFSVVSGGSLLLLRQRFKPWFAGQSLGVQITGADDDFLGHVAEVAAGFTPDYPGRGRVSYRGAAWDAHYGGEAGLKPGDQVRITGRNGSVLTVDKE